MLWSSFKWLKSYNENVAHENCVLSNEFWVIDNRRELENRQFFGRLRRFESSRVFDSWFRLRLMGSERRRLITGFVQLIYIGAFVFVYMQIAGMFYRLMFYAVTTTSIHVESQMEHELQLYVGGNVGRVIDLRIRHH